jgi:type IV secretory pathway ATPase VirB11/archaellum biosynthesis ATPase
MTKTYRDIAMSNMLGTVEDAMREVLNCWAELPAPMTEAIDQFRTQLAAAIDSVEFVKKALNMEVRETGSRHRLG